MKYQKLSFVIPVYNEARTLATLLDKVLAVAWPLEIELVCINDASKDSSLEILNGYAVDKRFKIIDNETNLGKSRSVKKGILASSGDLVVIQDSDLEYEPSDLLMFIEKFENSEVDMIYGNRFGKNNKVVYWSNWFGNRSLSFLSSVFTLLRAGFTTTDMETCYKMVRGDVIRNIAEKFISTSGFGFEPELTARLAGVKSAGKKLRYFEIPINYYPRTAAEGKHLKGLSDGVKALGEIIKFNLFVK